MKKRITCALLAIMLAFGLAGGLSAAASTARHPFAIALEDFFKDATGDTAAYLADINGDGVYEMLAWKGVYERHYWDDYSYEDEGYTHYRFFYIQNGNLYTYDEIHDPVYRMFISSNNHLVTNFDLSYWVHLFIDGVFVPEAVEFPGWWDDEYSNGLGQSKAEYDAYAGQYGIPEQWVDRQDDTARILAMTIAPEEIKVTLDGRPLTFDVAPQIINGRTVVPLRAIFEAMGAAVEWNRVTQTVTATKGGTVVVLKIGDTSPTVNGQVLTIDQPGIVVNGRTLAPLRFVAEAFGGTVEWDGAARTASITGG